MSTNPQPPEPSASALKAAEKLTAVAFANPPYHMRDEADRRREVKHNARVIDDIFTEELATARAALAQCEEKLAERTREAEEALNETLTEAILWDTQLTALTKAHAKAVERIGQLAKAAEENQLALDCLGSLAKLVTNDDGIDPEAFHLELTREEANLIKLISGQLADHAPRQAGKERI